MAPQWENGACDQTCQENVSACMLAHINTAGNHVPLWIVSPNSAVGWGLDPAYPNEEATFFGNIFTPGAHGTNQSTYPMYYCAGPQVKTNPPSGRLGSAQTSPPYVNVFGSQYAQCGSNGATPADYPYAPDGFKAISGWNYPVTIWRENTTTPTITGTGGTTGSSLGTGGTSGTSTMPPPPPPPGHGFRDLDYWP